MNFYACLKLSLFNSFSEKKYFAADDYLKLELPDLLYLFVSETDLLFKSSQRDMNLDKKQRVTLVLAL